MDAITYGPAEVCAALGLKRDTLHGWAARQLLDFAGPARAGVARKFKLLDVIRIGAMSHMTGLGIGVGHAHAFAKAIDRLPVKGDYLLVTCDPPSRHSLAGMVPTGELSSIVDIDQFTNRLRVMDRSGAVIRNPGSYFLDLFEVSNQVRRGLEDSDWRPDLTDADGRPDVTVFAILQRGQQETADIKAHPPRRGRRKPVPPAE